MNTFYLSFKKIIAVFSLVILVSCTKTPMPSNEDPVDVLLIGAGIMSASLGSILSELDPNLKMHVYERLDGVALESSDAINNAGTGHSAFCELNYTPEREDGTIDISKAVRINEDFELSRQFWAYTVEQGKIKSPQEFINKVPHMSFVWGEKNVNFLRKRYETLKKNPLFFDMEYTENIEQIVNWAPLLMEQRKDKSKRFAATRVIRGTDVNFGAITRALIKDLSDSDNSQVFLNHEVQDMVKNPDNTWTVVVKDLKSGRAKSIKSRFVFIGAGGGALPLLQKSGIEEAKKYAGFPVGGQWLLTDDPEITQKHLAKVYGMASVGSPPMSVPHLDTRFINGKRMLLFGPFAVFSTKFLKEGSWTDIFASFKWHNIVPMIQAGLKNFHLTKYLVRQVLLSDEERLASLQRYFAGAELKDWHTKIAGQRVQIIKKDEEKGGVLQFGTEVVSSKDNSLVALLGASPGASTAAKIAIDVLEKSFARELTNDKWKTKMKEIFPSYRKKLSLNPKLYEKIRERNARLLNLP